MSTTFEEEVFYIFMPAAAGTYEAVGSGAICGLGKNNSAYPEHVWYSSSGTITLSTLTATRASGTFSCTLMPSPATAATGTIVFGRGTFDVTF